IVYEKEDVSPDVARVGEKFMMRVFDNSMKPRIQENDYVVILRQDSVESGSLALLSIGGSMLTIKRVEAERGGYLLSSNSPFFRPVFYSAEDIRRIPVKVIGKVVELRALF
ncbi:MAG: S24 family peptidase, partial [Clostridia bacterium]|nr:S24 family peptidase [Clostridia bacterium]